MGRPERVFTDEEIKEIKELAPALTQEQLAVYFDISIRNLRDILKRDDRVFAAYTKSRYKEGVLAAKTLRDKAIIDKDFPSLKLYLSQTLGWTEKSRTEHVGDGGGPVEIDQHWIVELVAPGED
jgi:hypothetical protein|tara:strand:+ start:75 stop:446 length:372 start_codon:yes stop_codon:yes gene_type:complete